MQVSIVSSEILNIFSKKQGITKKDAASIALDLGRQARELKTQAQGATNLRMTSQATRFNLLADEKQNYANLFGTLAVRDDYFSRMDKYTATGLGSDGKLTLPELVLAAALDGNIHDLSSNDFRLLDPLNYSPGMTITQRQLEDIAAEQSSTAASTSYEEVTDAELASLLNALNGIDAPGSTNDSNELSQLLLSLDSGQSGNGGISDSDLLALLDQEANSYIGTPDLGLYGDIIGLGNGMFPVPGHLSGGIGAWPGIPGLGGRTGFQVGSGGPVWSPYGSAPYGQNPMIGGFNPMMGGGQLWPGSQSGFGQGHLPPGLLNPYGGVNIQALLAFNQAQFAMQQPRHGIIHNSNGGRLTYNFG